MGNFGKFVQKKGTLTEAESKLYFAQIVCGVNHMHSLGIAHRDIKLQNVLLVKCEKSISGDCTLLMADFGLSRIMHHEDGEVALNRTICGMISLRLALEACKLRIVECILLQERHCLWHPRYCCVDHTTVSWWISGPWASHYI